MKKIQTNTEQTLKYVGRQSNIMILFLTFHLHIHSGLSTHTKYHYEGMVGLDRTGHMSFLTGQDRTPKFAGQVLPDRTESGLIFLNILPYK